MENNEIELRMKKHAEGLNELSKAISKFSHLPEYENYLQTLNHIYCVLSDDYTNKYNDEWYNY